MIDLFSPDLRRNPYPVYEALRRSSPVVREPRSGLWMVFTYDGVKRVLTDPATFSSRHGPDWLIFADPPRHTKLRALVSQAFTPRTIANLEGRIRALSRELLDPHAGRETIDLATEYAVPLPMRVIAEMLGVSAEDRGRFQRWIDGLLEMSYTIPGGPGAKEATAQFVVITGEMKAYVGEVVERRQAEPRDDLLTKLAQAEVNGERLTPEEITGFFQLLLLAGSETTTNLINNAFLCFAENPEALASVRATPERLPAAMEEVLRYRSPLQWMYRIPTRDVEVHGQKIPAGQMVLAMIGAANHDPAQFREPGRFDISREPNAHLGFGHGVHFCLGAALARLEARIALTDLLGRLKGFELANAEPWEPRVGLHVHGPARLGIRYS
jgi:cytochrome P450